MGAYLDKPVLEKVSRDEKFSNFKYGVSLMQGWRIDMEDAECIVPDLDDDTAFFGVFDGHGGREVACYLAKHMPKFLLQANSYTDNDLQSALKEAFLDADRALLTDEGQEELKTLAKPDDSQDKSSSDSETERVEAVELLEEADMPLDDLLAKYGRAGKTDKDKDKSESASSKASKDENEDNKDKEEEEEEGKESDKNDMKHQAVEHLKTIAADVGLDIDVEQELEEGGSSSGGRRKKQKPTRVTRTATRTVRAVADEGDIEEEDDDSSDESGIEEDNNATTAESPEESGSSSSDEEEDNPSKIPPRECGFESGSTALVALIRGCELYVASAGDSRCVMCRNGETVALSVDHKPEDEGEMKRINNAGGVVDHTGRVNGGLNLSRAIGDHAYKQNKHLKLEDQMISSVPDIQHETLSSDDDFIILASDGIWNKMNSQQCVEFVKEQLAEKPDRDLSGICELMIDHCLAPDTTGDGTGCDNMTVVIVQFMSDTTDKDKSTASVSPGKSKVSGKRGAVGGPDVDSSHQSKRPRLEAEAVQ